MPAHARLIGVVPGTLSVASRRPEAKFHTFTRRSSVSPALANSGRVGWMARLPTSGGGHLVDVGYRWVSPAS